MRIRAWGISVVAVIAAGCRPSDILSVPPSASVIASGSLQNQAAAEEAFAGSRTQFFAGFSGNGNLLNNSTLITDEYTWGYSYYNGAYDVVDARISTFNKTYQPADAAVTALLGARSALLQDVALLQTYETGSGLSKVGEAYALTGYDELLIAEDYCAGVPLSYIKTGGGIVYGQPLTSDSLLGAAETHFDSAIAHANGDVNILSLAGIGLGRTLVDLGHFADAATAVGGVATGYVYNAELFPSYTQGYTINVYSAEFPSSYGCGQLVVGDREGGNGLNFVSAGDQRVAIDSSMQTCDGQDGAASPETFYYATKFGDPPTGLVPLATGAEARLIEAEAALQSGDVTGWAADLNTLRTNAPTTYLQLADSIPSLTMDSTLSASATLQVDVMFRERAFWLFGTGSRLGDMRRLIRQYSRDQATVFPTGPYINARYPTVQIPTTYGNDVSLPLPTVTTVTSSGTTITNPYYKGCLSPPSTA